MGNSQDRMDGAKSGGVLPVNGGTQGKNVYTEGYYENCPSDDGISSCGGGIKPLHIIMVGKRGETFNLAGRSGVCLPDKKQDVAYSPTGKTRPAICLGWGRGSTPQVSPRSAYMFQWLIEI